MRHIGILLLTLGLLLGACGGDDTAATTTTAEVHVLPEAIDWAEATTITAFFKTGASTIRELRTVTVSGPGAAAQQSDGSVAVEFRQQRTPEALGMTLTVSGALADAHLIGTGGATRMIVIGGDVWAAGPEDEWRRPPNIPQSNPLFGPYQPLLDTMDGIITGAQDALTFEDYEDVNGIPTLKWVGTDFTMTTPTGTVAEIASLTVWIAEAQYLVKAEMVTRGGDAEAGTDFSYLTTYELLATGEDFTITAPE